MDEGGSAFHNGINVGGGMYAPFGMVEKPGAELLPPTDNGRFMVTRLLTQSFRRAAPAPLVRNGNPP